VHTLNKQASQHSLPLKRVYTELSFKSEREADNEPSHAQHEWLSSFIYFLTLSCLVCAVGVRVSFLTIITAFQLPATVGFIGR